VTNVASLMVAMVFASFAVFNTFNVAIRLNNLLVDFLLPALALAAIAGCFAYRNRFWMMSLHTAVVLGLLSIVKVSGLFFVLLALVVYIACVVRLLVRKRARLKALIMMVTTILASFLPFIIWQKHVSNNFPNAASAKHAVSMADLGKILTGHVSGEGARKNHQALY
jgi:4-amino-4-deoxy-L-arabinose transferase-like glycosyltransferase